MLLLLCFDVKLRTAPVIASPAKGLSSPFEKTKTKGSQRNGALALIEPQLNSVLPLDFD